MDTTKGSVIILQLLDTFHRFLPITCVVSHGYVVPFEFTSHMCFKSISKRHLCSSCLSCLGNAIGVVCDFNCTWTCVMFDSLTQKRAYVIIFLINFFPQDIIPTIVCNLVNYSSSRTINTKTIVVSGLPLNVSII